MSRRTLGVLAVAAACILVWIASAELRWPARALTTALLVLLPVALVGQHRALADEVPDELSRHAIYVSSAASIWLLAIVAMAAASTSGFTRRLVGLVELPLPTLLAATGATLAAGLALLALGRLLGIREAPLLELLLPRSGRDRIAFVGLSISAGVGEELVYRSFLIPALTAATGHLWLAVALSSAAFGLVHSYQRVAGVVRASILGLVLALPFVLTGSVLPSMLAHAALDLVAGLWLADWLVRR